MEQHDVNAIQWDEHDFYPIVPSFPPRDQVSVLDLTGSKEVPPVEEQKLTPPYSVGRYDEQRNIYNTEIFNDGRCLHVGLGKEKI